MQFVWLLEKILLTKSDEDLIKDRERGTKMVIKSLESLQTEPEKLPYLKEALQCLKEHEKDVAPARFEFQGGFLMLQDGITTSVTEGEYEAHKKYLDVQVLLDGTETVVWNDIQNLKESIPYDNEKDKVMYVGEGSMMTLLQGTCYICWPEDGHKACRHVEQATYYRKAVIKLLLSDGV